MKPFEAPEQASSIHLSRVFKALSRPSPLYVSSVLGIIVYNDDC